jgi:hypothetical protein
LSTLSISQVVRTILTENLALPADEVIKKAKARGVVQSENTIRNLVYNIRSELKKKMARGSVASRTSSPARPEVAAKSASTSAKPTASTKLSPPVRKPSASAKLPAPSRGPADVAHVFANVTLVNEVIGVCGGVEHARQTIEAVQACGGVKAFLQHLDLVAAIKSDKPAE